MIKKLIFAMFLAGAGISQAQTISPPAGSYTGSVLVTLTAPAGATIFYTTDGTKPTAASIKYVAPFTITSSQTVNYITVSTSAMGSAAYIIVPAPTLYNFTLNATVTAMKFSWTMGSATPALQTAQVRDSSPCPPPAGQVCHWPVTASSDAAWLTVNGGTTSFPLAASINTAALKAPGTFTGTITLTQASFKTPTIKIPVSIVVTGVTPPPPPGHQAILKWSALPNAASYKIYKGATVIFSGNATTFTDANLVSGNACYSATAVYVSGVYKAGESVKSNQVCILVP